MYKTKLNKIRNLIEEIKNDITTESISHFLNWFYEKLNIHFKKNTPNIKIKKGSIFYINLGQNIGSELNKTRPCIIYSDKKANFGNTIIVIPLKSYKGKKLNDFQLIIKASNQNNLNKDSIADISSLRQISKKRLLDKIGNIENKHYIEIDSILLKIFGIKK